MSHSCLIFSLYRCDQLCPKGCLVWAYRAALLRFQCRLLPPSEPRPLPHCLPGMRGVWSSPAVQPSLHGQCAAGHSVSLRSAWSCMDREVGYSPSGMCETERLVWYGVRKWLWTELTGTAANRHSVPNLVFLNFLRQSNRDAVKFIEATVSNTFIWLHCKIFWLLSPVVWLVHEEDISHRGCSQPAKSRYGAPIKCSSTNGSLAHVPPWWNVISTCHLPCHRQYMFSQSELHLQ